MSACNIWCTMPLPRSLIRSQPRAGPREEFPLIRLKNLFNLHVLAEVFESQENKFHPHNFVKEPQYINHRPTFDCYVSH